jgi:hypothetical protein
VLSLASVILLTSTDIPVNIRAVLKGGKGVLNKDDTTDELGRTVLPYLPPHPARSNPKMLHRYVFTLLEQSGPTSGISLDDLPSATSDVSVDDTQRTEPDALEIEKRTAIMPLLALMKKYDLQWRGFGYITSIWSPKTSEVFKALGTFTNKACMSQCMGNQQPPGSRSNTDRGYQSRQSNHWELS